MRSTLDAFMRLLAGLLAKRTYVARKPHLVVTRTVDAIGHVQHKRRKQPVPVYGVEYEDRSRYTPHIGAKQRRKAVAV